MTPSIITRRIGEVAVTAVSDGTLKSSFDALVGIAPEEARRFAGVADQSDMLLPVYTFLLQLADQRVLVDTGGGARMGPTLGYVTQNLRAVGIAPDSIDAVVLTHIHPDHSHGLVDAENRANFPNAELIVRREEAAFWLDRDPRPEESERVRRNILAARETLAPYRARMRTVGDGEAFPGLSAHLRPGHTPGHTAWLLTSAGERLLIWGDSVHLPAVQVPRPEVTTVFDVEPDRARASRLRTLAEVAEADLMVAGAHLDGAFARIRRAADGFRVDAPT